MADFTTLSVTDKVGIGTENPIAQLHISSSTAAPSQAFLESGGALLKLSVDTSGAKLGTDNAFSLSILTDGSPRMTIDPVGNVGIGTTPTPTEKLTVNGNLKATSFLGNGATLDGIVKKAGDTMTGALMVQNDLTVTGKVGIHTSTPKTWLDVQSPWGDWLFLTQERDRDGGGGFHIHNPWGNSNQPQESNDRNALAIAYQTSTGQDLWEKGLSFHGPTGNVTVGGGLKINGDLYCAGSKTGFVADYFVNRVGDTLEQGDVVVIGEYQVSHYSGTQNNIPILEVDLTDRACDTRVCGIVAKFVTEQDLPFAEVEPNSETPPPELIEQLMSEATENSESYNHPLKSFASEFKEDADPNKVQDKQMGLMVTLGAFSHCKVDADIAPIAVGDLLTTSPTRGHAQKVLEAEKAVGAIVGKALASLEKGKGKIPVLVMLQ